MTTYFPATTILPYLTDAALHAETAYEGDVAKLLLTIPAEYRQPVAAVHSQRTYTTTYGPAGAERIPVRDSDEVWREVLTEVGLQLAQEGVR